MHVHQARVLKTAEPSLTRSVFRDTVAVDKALHDNLILAVVDHAALLYLSLVLVHLEHVLRLVGVRGANSQHGTGSDNGHCCNGFHGSNSFLSPWVSIASRSRLLRCFFHKSLKVIRVFSEACRGIGRAAPR